MPVRTSKQAFCLLDSSPYRSDAPPPKFTCAFQGITRGWQDVYESTLDCQWLDVTGLPPGQYLLRIVVNGQRIVAEGDYSNNVAEILVTMGP